MISNMLTLTEDYTTRKVITGNKKESEMVNVPVIFEKDLPKSVAVKMRSSAIPIAIATTFTAMQVGQGVGLWDSLAPIILPILYDAGRVLFYVNGAKAIYRMCGGDTKGAIRQFKDVAMGYALLIGLDGIMYFIETYVEAVKNGLMDNAINTVSQTMQMLGGAL